MVFLPRDNGEVLLWQYTRVSSTSSQSTLPIEDIEHVLTQCVGTSDTRRAKLPALLSLAATAKSTINIEKISSNNSILTQFLLDCTSCNLDNDTRISAMSTCCTRCDWHHPPVAPGITGGRIRGHEICCNQSEFLVRLADIAGAHRQCRTNPNFPWTVIYILAVSNKWCPRSG